MLVIMRVLRGLYWQCQKRTGSFTFSLLLTKELNRNWGSVFPGEIFPAG